MYSCLDLPTFFLSFLREPKPLSSPAVGLLSGSLVNNDRTIPVTSFGSLSMKCGGNSSLLRRVVRTWITRSRQNTSHDYTQKKLINQHLLLLFSKNHCNKFLHAKLHNLRLIPQTRTPTSSPNNIQTNKLAG